MEATRMAPAACRQYLDHLSLPLAQRSEIESQLEAQLAAQPAATTREAMAILHRILAGDDAETVNPAFGSIAARAQTAIEQDDAWACDDTTALPSSSCSPPT